MGKSLVVPAPLRRGDKVAVVSPASPVREEFIDGAVDVLRRRGYVPVVMPAAKGPAYGTYAAARTSRIADFLDAWRDRDVKAVLCSRGGYGSVDILDFIVSEHLLHHAEANPKWLVGFSDISALHALISRAGIVSLHAPMAKDISRLKDCREDELPDVARLFDVLEGRGLDAYRTTPHVFDRPGHAEGILCGGNLATLNGLAATPFDALSPDAAEGRILFIEDIGEQVYEINRMLCRLHMAGTLRRLAGIVVGQFTDYRPDRTYTGMENMIDACLRDWGVRCPVLFGFPAGHVDVNMPLPVGADCTLDVTPQGSTLSFPLLAPGK